MKTKNVKREWKKGSPIALELLLGHWDVTMYGWLKRLWWLKGDRKHISETNLGLRGYNVLPNGKKWGRFKVMECRNGLLLDYSVSTSYIEKRIRDVVRYGKDYRIVGRFRYAGILTGWFTLEKQ